MTGYCHSCAKEERSGTLIRQQPRRRLIEVALPDSRRPDIPLRLCPYCDAPTLEARKGEEGRLNG